MLMDNLPRLRRQPLAAKITMLHKLGGHPHSIELLEGWLASGRVTICWTTPPGRHAARAVGRLLPDSAVGPAGPGPAGGAGPAEHLPHRAGRRGVRLRRGGQRHRAAPGWTCRWCSASRAGRPWTCRRRWRRCWTCCRRANGASSKPGRPIRIHPVVREYLLAEHERGRAPRLHRWAAAYHGQPFVEIARRYAAQSGQTWTEEQIEAFARERRWRRGPDGGAHR